MDISGCRVDKVVADGVMQGKIVISVDGLHPSEVVDSNTIPDLAEEIGIDRFVKHFGEDEVLNFIGADRVARHFNLRG